MNNDTNALPRQGVAKMAEVAGTTGELGGRQGTYPEGLWRHPNGAEIITQNSPLLGDNQGRAAERMGFVYVGPAPEGRVKTLGAPSEQPKAEVNELAELRARLAALEAAQGEKAVVQDDSDEPSYKELQARAKELGVSSKGPAEELKQRIAEAENSQDDAQEENK